MGKIWAPIFFLLPDCCNTPPFFHNRDSLCELLRTHYHGGYRAGVAAVLRHPSSKVPGREAAAQLLRIENGRRRNPQAVHWQRLAGESLVVLRERGHCLSQVSDPGHSQRLNNLFQAMSYRAGISEALVSPDSITHRGVRGGDYLSCRPALLNL